MNAFLEHLAKHRFVIIGHRGAAGLAAENTIASIRAALQWQCSMIEIDVHATADASGDVELLVIHDRQLNRTTDGKGVLSDFTTEQLRTLDAGNGQRIPFLSDVITLLHQHLADTGDTVALNIELKGAHTAGPVASTLAGGILIPVLVSSFNHTELRRFRKLDPSTPVAPLYDSYAASWPQTAADLAATAINIGTGVVTKARVEAMRNAGYYVFVYTVNSVKRAMRLRSLGVAGVFTDRPDKLSVLQRD